MEWGSARAREGLIPTPFLAVSHPTQVKASASLPHSPAPRRVRFDPLLLDRRPAAGASEISLPMAGASRALRRAPPVASAHHVPDPGSLSSSNSCAAAGGGGEAQGRRRRRRRKRGEEERVACRGREQALGGGLLPSLHALLAHALPRHRRPLQALRGTPPPD